MNRDVQRIIDSTNYKRLFPETTLFGKNIRTVAGGTWLRNSDLFEVVNKKGSYRSAGLGGGIAGMGFDFGIIDDPIKNAADARSQTLRDSQWEWLTSDFLTRQAPSARILMTLTRWNWDDVAGRLLKLAEEDPAADQWVVLRLPAIAEQEKAHLEDPRNPGEALWPERFGLPFLEGQRAALGPYGFGSLYQQLPTPREGGLFTLANLSRVIAAAPADVVGRVRAWDKGYAALGDWTAGVLMSKTREGVFTIEVVVRVRCHPNERNRIIKITAEQDDARYGKPVLVLLEQPPGAGSETTKNLLLQLAGHRVQAVLPRGDKSERAEPLADQCEAGNVRLVRGSWNRDFINESCQFPGGQNDDQVDAASTAFLALTGRIPLKIAVI